MGHDEDKARREAFQIGLLLRELGLPEQPQAKALMPEPIGDALIRTDDGLAVVQLVQYVQSSGMSSKSLRAPRLGFQQELSEQLVDSNILFRMSFMGWKNPTGSVKRECVKEAVRMAREVQRLTDEAGWAYVKSVWLTPPGQEGVRLEEFAGERQVCIRPDEFPSLEKNCCEIYFDRLSDLDPPNRVFDWLRVEVDGVMYAVFDPPSLRNVIQAKCDRYKAGETAGGAAIPARLWLVITTCDEDHYQLLDDSELDIAVDAAGAELARIGSPFDRVYWLRYGSKQGAEVTLCVVRNVRSVRPHAVADRKSWVSLKESMTRLSSGEHT